MDALLIYRLLYYGTAVPRLALVYTAVRNASTTVYKPVDASMIQQLVYTAVRNASSTVYKPVDASMIQQFLLILIVYMHRARDDR